MNIRRLSFAAFAIFLLAACQQNGSKTPKTSTTEQPTSSANKETLTWAGDKDLVCEMKVDKTTEDTAHYVGKIYGFCNPSCKESFQADPAKYVGK